MVRAMETTVAAVESSYWDLVYARRNVEVQRSALEEAEELLELNRRRLDVQVGTRLDVIIGWIKEWFKSKNFAEDAPEAKIVNCASARLLKRFRLSSSVGLYLGLLLLRMLLCVR